MGELIWRAALALLGTRFRLHGRDPASGLDCVGLVAAAHRGAGIAVPPLPDRYRLSGPGEAVALGWLARSELVRVSDAVVGDVILADMGRACGGAQLHLMIGGQSAVIHADAGLGRVVMTPCEVGCLVPGRMVARWRWQHSGV